MRLGLKFAFALATPLIVLSALFAYFSQQHNQRVLSVELVKEGRAIALVVQTVAQDYLGGGDFRRFTTFVDEVSGYERLLGMRVFGPDGKLLYQPPSLDAYPFEDTRSLERVLKSRHPVDLHRTYGGRAVLSVLFPLQDRQGRLLGAGEVLQLESYIAADARANLNFVMLLTMAMVASTVIAIVVVTRISVTKPIAELVSSIRRAGGGDLSARVPVRGNDELARLALEFNGMCERLQSAQLALTQEQLMRKQAEGRLRNADRLAGLGRLSAGLAHEIGTPLNVISGRAESLTRRLHDHPTAVASLAEISTQAERIERIVRDMLDFARTKAPQRGAVPIAPVLRAVLELARAQLERGHVRVETDLPARLPPVIADDDQLQQVFLNLVLNALDAMPSGGLLRIQGSERTCEHPRSPGGTRRWVAVSVEDTGTGIPPEYRDRLFDPFFTTKEPGKGTGLGLSVSYGIVEEHGGWFDLESEPGHGTRMIVHLPAGPEFVESAVVAGEIPA